MCEVTKRFGEHVYKEGLFRGIFGIDFVVDMETYEVFLMEINPRITG
jgi:biotin carboxylase